MPTSKNAFRKYVSPMGGHYEEGPEGRVANRTMRLQVLVSEDEFMEIRRAARLVEGSVSSWLRTIAMREIDRMVKGREELEGIKRAYGINDGDAPVKKTLENPAGARRVQLPAARGVDAKTAKAEYKDVLLDLDVRDDTPGGLSIAALLDDMDDGPTDDSDDEGDVE